jgi:hypothetical protein
MWLLSAFLALASGKHSDGRRVMGWMSADCFDGNKPVDCTGNNNRSDIDRQVAEIKLRAAAGQLTDLSPTTYKVGPGGTIVYDRCGPVCESLQSNFSRMGLRVHPLVAIFNIGAIMGDALQHAEVQASALVNLTLKHGYDGINLDFEPLDCQNCASPSNCTLETAALVGYVKIVSDALHSHGKEVQIDFAAWMQTHNFGSYPLLAASNVDRICSMDTYGKLGDVFRWITQLNMASSCKSWPGATGLYPCNGQMKLSLGIWPLQPSRQYQGGIPSKAAVDEIFSESCCPNGLAFMGVKHVSVWDAFGETWSNSTGGLLPGVHRSIPEFWWDALGQFLVGGP